MLTFSSAPGSQWHGETSLANYPPIIFCLCAVHSEFRFHVFSQPFLSRFDVYERGREGGGRGWKNLSRHFHRPDACISRIVGFETLARAQKKSPTTNGDISMLEEGRNEPRRELSVPRAAPPSTIIRDPLEKQTS